MSAAAAGPAASVRLRVHDRWVVRVPLERYVVRPVGPDGVLGAPLDGLSPVPDARLRVLDLSGAAVVDAAPAGLAEPETELDPGEVAALAPALAGLLSAGAASAAAARGRALLAAATRGVAADVAAARQADRDACVWRSVHATSLHAVGTPRAAVPDWLALQPRDPAVAWRAGAFGPAPRPAPAPAGRADGPAVPRDPERVRAQATAQQGHGFAKPALSVGLTAAMALALTGCGGGDDVAVDDDDAVCIDQQTQEVLSDEFCDDDGPRPYGGGVGIFVFGGSFISGAGGKRYARGYSTARPGGSLFGGGSRGSGGG